ncbi:cAMP-specific 3',5'-cyclic phosphodiesterase 4B [Clonorchis sinensis]|uniref:Phosphodiesterase n=1 Tax=Clonorchis sinensis TaxID=79923 RepID=A0A8T1M1Y2_CLOSI|nr:cAMP-specific 3',5'-cyclic phosphodiesterase 4B [Clonorchis sinensis]
MWKGWLCCHTVPPRKSGRPSKSPSPKSKPKGEHTTTVKVCEPVQNNHDSRNATENSAAIPNLSTTKHDDLPPPVSTTNGISPVPEVGSTTAKHSRPEGPSVSFTTNVDFEQDTTSLEHTSPRLRSFTYRPAWTLQDVPGGDDFDMHIAVSRLSDDKSSRQSTKTSQECVRTSCRSFTKFLDEDDDALFTNTHRFSKPGSLFHPTFVLPRISTEPNASTMSESMDDMAGQPLKWFPVRRGSMIVRSGRTNVAGNATLSGTSPDQTVAMEGVIVTPFAQVLVSLQRIRHAFIRLTSAQSTHRFGVISSAVPEPTPSELLLPDSPEYKAVAMETLEELEWCLKQLENIQTKRPVSDMAFSKFKRLLNKELNSFGETDKSRHEISAYICGTFLEDEKDTEANQQIEQMLERRRSSGQSHGSSNTAEQSTALAGSKSKPVGEKETSSLIPDGPTSELITRPPDSSANIQVAPDEGIDDGTKDVSKSIQMPVNGIVTPNDIELDERFTQTLDTWGADIFEIDRLSDGHALTTTAYRIFQKRDLLRTFSIDPATLVRYLLKVEANYHPDVPYHNALHAADVTQTSHFLLQAEPLEDVFSDLEILAVIFASIVHDVDHPGLTNQFLINSGHDLALQYNDSSVLENHHLYVAFKLLNQPDCDIFSSLGVKKRQTLRRMVIELVLATDMSKHMSLLADLRTMVEAKKVSGSGVLNLDNYSDRIQILQNMIHCADLSNPAKPLRLNRKWTSRLMEEFFRQGDKERSLNLEISPMCDRESVAVEKSQVTFIDFVAHPLLESWCDLVHPSSQLILDILADNRDWYDCQSEGSRTSGVSRGRTRLATAEEDDEEATSAS